MFLKSFRRSKLRDTTEVLARIYGPCPACGGDSADHSVWELASARPHDADSQAEVLEEAVAQRNWGEACKVREFLGLEDAVVYVFLRCPKTGGITLLRLLSYFAMWLDDQVADRWILTAEEAEAAKELVGNDWKRVGERGVTLDV